MSELGKIPELKLIRQFCARDDLSTSDPFDIWKTSLGFHVKNFHHDHRTAGFFPAAVLLFFDHFINNRTRFFYRRQEFPIVRALAAQILLEVYKREGLEWALEYAIKHLEWLQQHSCEGYSGPCWGLGFRYAVEKGLIYESNMPLSTMTPYALEAYVMYSEITGDQRYINTIKGIYRFFENDVQAIEETDTYLVTSYSARKDRRVVNAVSYAMYSYALMLPYLTNAEASDAFTKIKKLYAYVAMCQLEDGSWFYSQRDDSFIDCFHSCIVVKNLIKTLKKVDLPDARTRIKTGYKFITESFYIPKHGLFKRFAVTTTPSLIKFDLYDNAEVLNLASLMQDSELVRSLKDSIQREFVRGDSVFSHIDRLGFLRNRNSLRWAVLPFLAAHIMSDN